MPEPAQSERALFSAALEYSAGDERRAFLDEACASDRPLRARLEALLAASDEAGSLFLERENDSTPRGRSAAEAPIREGAGSRIERFKLLERIGEGGFGVVYLAEQEAPVRRRVALKIVKLGMDTRAVVARFEAERQALAMMDHPNIAKVLDGGATSFGRPYFVMELVRGVPITTFCREHRLPLRRRLELFMEVCHAVQHAHQKGVIHRDLKPSNILVALHDDRPVPKVIDFGIAKATELRLTDKTIHTRVHQSVGTPAYMSPEQTGIPGLDVDTRTDIYSLGVLLHELVTDRTPFDAKELLAHGLEGAYRIIREKEPTLASQRLATLPPIEKSDVAHDRRTDFSSVLREVRGDLDVIVQKCLEKDRARRYESASGLAADLARHLGNEPVMARRPSARYRFAKFVRRHRGPVAFAGVVLLALLGGIAGTLTQAQRATRHAAGAEEQRRRADAAALAANEQRDFALRQLSRAEAINDLNAFLLSDAAPGGKPFTVGELLARAEHIMDRDRVDTDENRVEILIALGRQYQMQDEDTKGRRLLTKAYELSRPLTDRSIRAKAESAFAAALANAGEFKPAEQHIRNALAELGDEPQFALPRVFCLMRGSLVAREAGDPQTAIERALAAQQLVQTAAPRSALQHVRLTMDLAECYRLAGRHREAVEVFGKAFAQLTALGRDDTERAGTLLNNWALSVQSLGNPLEAERLFRRAIEIGTSDGAAHNVSPMLLNNFARVLFALHRLDEAAVQAERAHEKALQAGDELVVGHSLNLRANIYRETGQLTRAEATIAELDARWKRMMPPGHVCHTVLASHRAMLALARGQLDLALAEADHAITLAQASSNPADFRFHMRLRRAEVLLKLNRLDEARQDATAAIEGWQKLGGPNLVSHSLGHAHLMLARIHRAKQENEAARREFATAHRNLLPTVGADHPLTREAASGSGLSF